MIPAKPCLTVWVDTDDVSKLEKIKGFMPAYMYINSEPINPYEWGKTENEDLIVRYRATSFVKVIKQMFIG